jgi:hypothetical protein
VDHAREGVSASTLSDGRVTQTVDLLGTEIETGLEPKHRLFSMRSLAQGLGYLACGRNIFWLSNSQVALGLLFQRI